MRAGETEVGMISPALFSLYVKNIPTAIHRGDLAICVNYTSVSYVKKKAVIADSSSREVPQGVQHTG
jgi:hypothetical protein